MTIKADFIVEMDYSFCLNFYSLFRRSFDRCTACCRENLGDRIMKRSKEKIGANVGGWGVLCASVANASPVFGMHGGTRRFHRRVERIQALLRFVKRVTRVGIVVVPEKIGFKVKFSSKDSSFFHRRTNKLPDGKFHSVIHSVIITCWSSIRWTIKFFSFLLANRRNRLNTIDVVTDLSNLSTLSKEFRVRSEIRKSSMCGLSSSGFLALLTRDPID